MSAQITKKQQKLIDEIALNEGFKSYKITLNEGSAKGDNYLGTTIALKIEDIPTKKALNLFLKAVPQNEVVRQKASLVEAFDREFIIYTVVFPQFSDLKNGFKVKIPDFFPKYYGILKEINEECLILENLKEIGFKMWNRKKPMDSHHVAAVMKQYGEFHAFSYVLRKLRPKKWEEIDEKLVDFLGDKYKTDEYKKSSIPMIERVFRATENNSKAIQALKEFMDNCDDFFEKTCSIKDENSVILHADCWCNNIMFKYEENPEIPSEIRLLDWQLSKIGNPIMDLSYFFYTCASESCLDSFNEYLKMYHDSLIETIKSFGLSENLAMNFEKLQEQWRIYGKFGMYCAFFHIKVMLTDQSEAPDLKEMSDGNSNVMDLFNYEISDSEGYDKRINILMSHMVENGFI